MENETNTTPAADTSAAENQTADNQNPAENTSDSAKTEKTFTQKELDDIVKNRLERARKDMPSKEELNAFKAWKDSQKTAEQKAADDLAAANTARETAENEKRALEIKVECLSKGVSPEYADDVIALAKGYVNDDTPIDKAVETIIAKYPMFCSKPEAPASDTEPQKLTTGIRVKSGAEPEKSIKPASDFLDICKENQVKRK